MRIGETALFQYRLLQLRVGVRAVRGGNNLCLPAQSGAFGFGLSQLLFAYLIVSSIRGRANASDKVWDDATPHGLEWTLSSPPPYHSFEVAPEVK